MLPYSNNPNKRKLKRLIMMKRLLFSLAFIALCFSFSKAQTYVQIGNGAESSSMPYTSWNYSWSKALYKSGDLGGTKTITKIALESEGTKTLNNQKIYLKTTTDDALTGTYEDPSSSGYTLVYDGNYSVTAGWNDITLDNQFDYNGSDNLIVYWINEDGSGVDPNFTATSTNEEVIKVLGGDNSVPTDDGWTASPQALPNIQFYYESDAPSNPTNPVPANNRIKVNVDTSLTFDIGENTTHYDVCFGTDKNNMDTIVDNQSVASAGTFTHSIDTLLQGDTKYYWQVIAINDTLGVNTNSAVWTFTTQGTIIDYPWSVGFEDVWEGVGGDVNSSIINTDYPDSTYWDWTDEVYDWTLEIDSNQAKNNVHSGHFGVQCVASEEGENFLRTPRFVLPSDMRISYWFRNGARGGKKASNTDTTLLQITTDGGTNWETLDTIAPDTLMQYTWKRHIINLSGYSSDNVYLRWVYKVSQTDASRYIFLDDVKVESRPDGPVMELGVGNISYKQLCVGGTINKEVVISNTGISDLNISGTDVTGDFECNYSGTIAPGENDTAVVSFKPTSAENHNGSITFNSDAEAGESEITLSGEAVEAVSSFFQAFDDSEELPSTWNSINSPDGYTGGGGVDIVSYSGDVFSSPNAAKILMSNDTVNPLLLVSEGVTNYVENQLTFYAKKASKSYDLEMQIGVMSNPYDASTFVPKTTISLDTVFRKDTVTFKPDTDEPYIAFKHNGNPNGPDDWTSLRIDNISWELDEPKKPLQAENLGPVDDTTNIDIMNPFELKWTSGSGNTSGFYLYFGKDTSNWELVNQKDLEVNKTSFAVDANLEYSTTYFWKVVPYNKVGEAEDCPVWSFKTMDDPIITSFEWTENFDDVTNTNGNTLPLGWSKQEANENTAKWDLWVDNPSGGGEYAHSAPNAMHIGLSNYYPRDDYLYTPPFELKDHKQYQLSFWWVAPTDPTLGKDFWERLKVYLGESNIDTTMNQTLFNDSTKSNEYEKITVKFTPEKTGRKFIGFYSWSAAYNNYVLAIDDLKLMVANSAPEITSEPDTTAVVDKEYVYEVTANDPEGDNIDIAAEEIPGWLDFTDNGEGTATLSGTPSSKGDYNVKLTSSDGTNQLTQEFSISVEEKDESTGISSVTGSELTIYPNPSDGEIKITVNNYKQYSNEQIKVMDMTGKIIEKRKVEGTNTILDLSNLKSGIYLIQVGSLKNRVTEKIILK
jgi:hypothetical protein